MKNKEYNYKCVVSNNGKKRYYKRVKGVNGKKWQRINNKTGMKAEKGKKKYGMELAEVHPDGSETSLSPSERSGMGRALLKWNEMFEKRKQEALTKKQDSSDEKYYRNLFKIIGFLIILSLCSVKFITGKIELPSVQEKYGKDMMWVAKFYAGSWVAAEFLKSMLSPQVFSIINKLLAKLRGMSVIALVWYLYTYAYDVRLSDAVFLDCQVVGLKNIDPSLTFSTERFSDKQGRMGPLFAGIFSSTLYHIFNKFNTTPIKIKKNGKEEEIFPLAYENYKIEWGKLNQTNSTHPDDLRELLKKEFDRICKEDSRLLDLQKYKDYKASGLIGSGFKTVSNLIKPVSYSIPELQAEIRKLSSENAFTTLEESVRKIITKDSGDIWAQISKIMSKDGWRDELFNTNSTKLYERQVQYFTDIEKVVEPITKKLQEKINFTDKIIKNTTSDDLFSVFETAGEAGWVGDFRKFEAHKKNFILNINNFNVSEFNYWEESLTSLQEGEKMCILQRQKRGQAFNFTAWFLNIILIKLMYFVIKSFFIRKEEEITAIEQEQIAQETIAGRRGLGAITRDPRSWLPPLRRRTRQQITQRGESSDE